VQTGDGGPSAPPRDAGVAVDAPGLSVLPGLIDAHCHISYGEVPAEAARRTLPAFQMARIDRYSAEQYRSSSSTVDDLHPAQRLGSLSRPVDQRPVHHELPHRCHSFPRRVINAQR
jgi:imidazolonepropionase-like amidohydrolase